MPARDRSRIVLGVTLVLAFAGIVFAEESSSGRFDELTALLKGGKYTEAETGARALLPQVEAASGAASVDVARVLDLLVESLLRGGKAGVPETRKLIQRALAIKEKALGPDDPSVAWTVSDLAYLFRLTGDYAAARPLFERALTIVEKAYGPDDPTVAWRLSTLAELLSTTGDYSAARPLFERALTIQEKTLNPDQHELAWSLSAFAIMCHTTGDYAAARPLFERALTIREKALGPDHLDVAWSLGALASLLRSSGDYAAALPLFERALAIREKALGPDHLDVAWSLGVLADVVLAMGDHAAARPLFERALAIREKALGPDHVDVAWVLNRIVWLLEGTGDYAAARPLQERALAIREKALGPNHPEVAQSLNTLARVLKATGDDTAARQLFERALAIREKALGPDHPDVALSLGSLADLRLEAGDYISAIVLYERALAIREKALGPDHPDVAWSLNRLAEVMAIKGDSAGAFDHALKAERITRQHVRLTGRSLSERQALQYAATRGSGLNLVLTLAGRGLDHDSRRRALDGLVRSRAVVLDEMAARHRSVSGAADPNVARLADTLASARGRIANMVVRGLGDQKPEMYAELLADARNEQERAERALAGASLNFARELSRSQLGLDDVTANLPRGSALIAFVQYWKIDLARKVSGGGQPGPTKHALCYLAFVLRAGERDPQAVDLGAVEVIDGLIARWMSEASGGTVEADYREVGTALRKRVWDPLVSALGDAGRVFIVPDGSLNLVNLAALPLDDGGYLIERGPLVHYVSAERDLVPSSETRRGDGLLALGVPSYDATSLFAGLGERPVETVGPARPKSEAPGIISSAATYRGQHSACGDFTTVRFKPLPATGEETREIVRLWKRQRPNDPSVKNGVFDLREATANETAFKRAAPGRRVLHLATHAFFLEGECKSALSSARGIGGLSETSSATTSDTSPPLTGENPLLLSGLALAGANNRSAARNDEDDGILTAEEIASLDLSGVEWAVLSACETGVGDIRAGEGVFGLRRAFQLAGARTLVMSLWSVDDEATRSWMKALYEGRLEGHLDTATAVRQASLEVLHDRRARKLSTHPFYWAAFVAAGDWR